LDTDIPSPEQMRLPRASAYNESQREDIRDWVLDKAMGKDVSQVLTTRVCEKCAKPTYEANLRCHHCQGVYEPCIVTGMHFILLPSIISMHAIYHKY
jgi:intraflagellar transport protein 172